MDIYLDIETDWYKEITVVGFWSAQTGLVQLKGAEITAGSLSRHLPPRGRLVTYNGHCFDLHVIRQRLGMDLRQVFDSLDLRWVCQRAGITGGQKAIEVRLGISRATDGIDGIEAMNLWERYRKGDREALRTLLHYNAEDIEGMKSIYRYLVTRRIL